MADRASIALAGLLHDLPSLSCDVADALQPLAPYLAPKHRDAVCRAEACLTGASGLPLAAGGLRSVWSLLSLQDAPPSLERCWQPMRPLSATRASQKHLFPTKRQPTAQERELLLHSFAQALRRLLPRVQSGGPRVLEPHLLALLQQYLHCVPAHREDEALFDHLRLTAAVAACLERSSGEEGRGFTLAVGDLSGIQDYIFDIANVGAGGVARRLRSRSLYVCLISDVVTHRLLAMFELGLANILVSSGGKFYALLPAGADTEARLQALQAEVDRWLLERFNAEIGLNLAWTVVDQASLGSSACEAPGFSQVVSHANGLLAGRKRQRLRFAAGGSGWVEERFLIRDDFSGHGACRSCRKRPAADAAGFCAHCAQDAEVGGQLPRTRYLSFYRQDAPPGAASMAFLDDFYVVPSERPPSRSDSPYLVVKLNDPDLDDLCAHSASFRYLANHVPQSDDGSTQTMEWIAAASRGRRLLGHLKADVDHLGALFAQGLRYQGRSHDSAVHQLMLSRELDLFFSCWLEHRLEGGPRRAFLDIYTVFSGGDDLYLIGPWHKSIPLAWQMNVAFSCFAGRNPDVSLSAGILLAKERYPIARAARDVEEVLMQAKEGHGEDAGRNRMALLGDVVGWSELPGVMREVRDIGAMGAGVTSSLLHELVLYGEMYASFARGDIAALRYKARFAYNLARSLHERDRNARRWAEQLMVDLNGPRAGERMRHMALEAACVLFQRRSREDS